MLAKTFWFIATVSPFLFNSIQTLSTQSGNGSHLTQVSNRPRMINGEVPSSKSDNEFYEEYVKPVSSGISPNGDGENDTLLIRYELLGSDNRCTMRIVATDGGYVKELITNDILTGSGQVLWDGRDDDNKFVKSGYYTLVTDVRSEKGNLRKFRSRIVVM